MDYKCTTNSEKISIVILRTIAGVSIPKLTVKNLKHKLTPTLQLAKHCSHCFVLFFTLCLSLSFITKFCSMGNSIWGLRQFCGFPLMTFQDFYNNNKDNYILLNHHSGHSSPAIIFRYKKCEILMCWPFFSSRYLVITFIHTTDILPTVLVRTDIVQSRAIFGLTSIAVNI